MKVHEGTFTFKKREAEICVIFLPPNQFLNAARPPPGTGWSEPLPKHSVKQ